MLRRGCCQRRRSPGAECAGLVRGCGRPRCLCSCETVLLAPGQGLGAERATVR